MTKIIGFSGPPSAEAPGNPGGAVVIAENPGIPWRPEVQSWGRRDHPEPERNLIKDAVFECLVCGGELPSCRDFR